MDLPAIPVTLLRDALRERGRPDPRRRRRRAPGDEDAPDADAEAEERLLDRIEAETAEMQSRINILA
jgi:hypothetical protein